MDDLQLEEDDTEKPAEWDTKLQELRDAHQKIKQDILETCRRNKERQAAAKAAEKEAIEQAFKKLRLQKEALLSAAVAGGKRQRKGPSPQEALESMATAGTVA